MKKLFTILFISCFISFPLYSQVDDKFSFLDENEVKKFGKPLVTSFGIGMNSGTFYTAEVPSLFGISIGIRGMMIFVPDDQLTFTPNLPAGYQAVNGKGETPTIFGSKDGGGIYNGPNGFIVYPGGIGESQIPILFPQATVSFLGTELLLRYVPLKIEDKKVNLFGVGLKHSISQYIPLLPVDIAVQVVYNKFSITDLVESSHLAFSGQVSKSLGFFTAYGGLQYESSNLTFDYEINGDPASGNPALRVDRKISAEVEGDNHVRLTVGGALQLAVIVINADVSLGSQTVVSSGLTFAF